MKIINSFNIPQDRSPGVYAIINITKMKCYIGETEDKEYRCKNHLSALTNKKHSCKEMQKDFNCGDKFKLIFLCNTPKYDVLKDERKILESYYYCCLKARGIKLYNSSKINYAQNFFLRASRTDSNIRELIQNIIQSNQ